MDNENSNNKNVSLSLIAEYGGSGSESESDSEVSNDITVTDHDLNDDSDAPELSEMVLKNNIINACAHGPLVRVDDDDEDEDPNSVRHMIIDPQSENGYEVAVYREDMSDSEDESSSDSDSDVDSIKDAEEISSGDEDAAANKTTKLEAPKVNGELGLEDLPPIEDLAISLPSRQTMKIGVIFNIVNQLVVVRSTPGSPAVDLDSVLFLDYGAKTLGKVFDVFGPVIEPHYAVRFNSKNHVLERGVCVGADVFIAPETRHTNLVFLPHLMNMKGTDASWKYDIEPPPSVVEYSDDEDERRAKREARNKNHDTEDGENSKNPRKVPDRRNQNQRPSESSSRFGSGPSRGRNPFSAASRRTPNTPQRYGRPWNIHTDLRTPPQHPEPPFGAPANFPYMYAPFNPNTPPPFYPNYRMRAPGRPMGLMRPNAPTFGSNYCNMPGGQPQWVSDPPPPPGT